jgi:hypothetical protein
VVYTTIYNNQSNSEQDEVQINVKTSCPRSSGKRLLALAVLQTTTCS